jgi:hypothetical protein
MAVQSRNKLAAASVDVTGDKTLAEGDNGVIQNVTVTGKVVTLPATAAGYQYIVRNGGQGATEGKVTVTISPNASDKIMGNGYTSADNKDIINTLGNGSDYVKLVGDGVNGWVVSEARGTWTREA